MGLPVDYSMKVLERTGSRNWKMVSSRQNCRGFLWATKSYVCEVGPTNYERHHHRYRSRYDQLGSGHTGAGYRHPHREGRKILRPSSASASTATPGGRTGPQSAITTGAHGQVDQAPHGRGSQVETRGPPLHPRKSPSSSRSKSVAGTTSGAACKGGDHRPRLFSPSARPPGSREIAIAGRAYHNNRPRRHGYGPKPTPDAFDTTWAEALSMCRW